MAKQLTINEAVKIIQESFEFGEKFDEAYSFLQDNDPNNAALVVFKDRDLNDIKKARAKEFLTKAVAEGDFGKEFDDAVALLKGDKETRKKVEEELEIFDRKNHLDMNDEEAVLRNVKKIDGFIDDLDYEKVMSDEKYSDMAKIITNTEIQFGGTDKEGVAVSKEEEEDCWNTLIETAKQQAAMLRTGDTSFFMKKDEDKKEVLDRDIKNFFTLEVVKGITASATPAPTKEEMVIGSPEYENYIQKAVKNAEEVLSSWFSGGKKAVLKTDNILNSAVDTSKSLFSYATRWAQKGFNRVADVFKNRKDKFDTKMRKIWKGSYEIRKAAVEQINNNKWRLITDTVATGIVAFSATGGLALPVVAGYALYSAAGSWGWPLIEKKTKEIRHAKKAGKDTKAWEGIAGIKKAFASIKSNEKEYKKYKSGAITGTAFGIAGAGLVAGVGIASNWAVDKLGYITARIGSSILRSAGAVTNQFVNYRNVKKDFKEEPSAENRAKLSQAKLGLGIGSVIALAGNALSFNNLVSSNADTTEQTVGFIDKIKGLFSSDKVVSETPNPVENVLAEQSSGNNEQFVSVWEAAMEEDKKTSGLFSWMSKQEEIAEVNVSQVELVVPTEYSSAMGISEAHWNEMNRKLAGIYENQSEIFGKIDVSHDAAWDKMYMNLDNAMQNNPELFGNNTKEQVLYKYMKLIEMTERVKEGPEGYLVTRLAKDGLPTYGTKDMTEVMRSLNSIIVCGDEVNISAEKVGTALGYINETTGAYVGPGANASITNNVYVGGRIGCDNDYQNAWKKGAEIVEEVVEQKEYLPQTVDVDDVVSNVPVVDNGEVVIDEVPINEVPEKQKVEIYEGATDGNLDINNKNVRSRKIVTVMMPKSGKGM